MEKLVFVWRMMKRLGGRDPSGNFLPRGTRGIILLFRLVIKFHGRRELLPSNEPVDFMMLALFFRPAHRGHAKSSLRDIPLQETGTRVATTLISPFRVVLSTFFPRRDVGRSLLPGPRRWIDARERRGSSRKPGISRNHFASLNCFATRVWNLRKVIVCRTGWMCPFGRSSLLPFVAGEIWFTFGEDGRRYSRYAQKEIKSDWWVSWWKKFSLLMAYLELLWFNKKLPEIWFTAPLV